MQQKQITRLWFLGPPFAILLSVAVYYWKFPGVRTWIDDRFPWVEEHVGRKLAPIGERPGTRPLKSSAKRVAPAPVVEPAPAPSLPPAPTPVPKPRFFAADGKVNVEVLAANKGDWPKSVKLRKAMPFPAVVNGKAVGKVEVPAGAQANLVSIDQGRLGLEYQGGGAWVAIEDTDLAERLPR